jgi:antitoxin component YwqK of YwqJK toxin-antitoxin module
MSNQSRLDLITTTLESGLYTLNGEVAQVLEQVRGANTPSEESLETTLVQCNKKLNELLEMLKDMRGELNGKRAVGEEEKVRQEDEDIEREDEDIEREDEDIREFDNEDEDFKEFDNEDDREFEDALTNWDLDS